MEFEELEISKNERKSLSRSSRIESSVFGFILTTFALVVYQFDDRGLLAIGVFCILYGLVGLEMFKTIYSIKVTHESLEIVKSYRQDIHIDLTKVKYIALRNNELQVYYSDYVKTYNLLWLAGDDYHALKAKLDEVCIELKDEGENESKWKI